MTSDATTRLLALWERLDQLGAQVRRVELAGLDDHTVRAMCAEAELRVRALRGLDAAYALRPA